MRGGSVAHLHRAKINTLARVAIVANQQLLVIGDAKGGNVARLHHVSPNLPAWVAFVVFQQLAVIGDVRGGNVTRRRHVGPNSLAKVVSAVSPRSGKPRLLPQHPQHVHGVVKDGTAVETLLVSSRSIVITEYAEHTLEHLQLRQLRQLPQAGHR